MLTRLARLASASRRFGRKPSSSAVSCQLVRHFRHEAAELARHALQRAVDALAAFGANHQQVERVGQRLVEAVLAAGDDALQHQGRQICGEDGGAGADHRQLEARIHERRREDDGEAGKRAGEKQPDADIDHQRLARAPAGLGQQARVLFRLRAAGEFQAVGQAAQDAHARLGAEAVGAAGVDGARTGAPVRDRGEPVDQRAALLIRQISQQQRREDRDREHQRHEDVAAADDGEKRAHISNLPILTMVPTPITRHRMAALRNTWPISVVNRIWM